ncbi:MAG: hypothetical protein REI11_20830 [Patulibacter sp.]|nr:hypothetical protein [Patulibacter sp.]
MTPAGDVGGPSSPSAGGALLPYRLHLCVALVGGGLAVFAAAAIAGASGTQLLLAFTAGGWLALSQTTLWVRARHDPSGRRPIPATAFAGVSVVAGCAAAAMLHGHHRNLAISLGLVAAWWGGDAIDWWARRRPEAPPTDLGLGGSARS